MHTDWPAFTDTILKIVDETQGSCILRHGSNNLHLLTTKTNWINIIFQQWIGCYDKWQDDNAK